MLTKEEQRFIKSRIKFKGLASRLGNLSREYIGMIFRGERDIKSPKAQAVVIAFQKVLEELYIKKSLPVFAVIKRGYVKENETMTEDATEVRFTALKTAIAFLLKKKNPEDYYITRQAFDGLYWISIEGEIKMDLLTK